MQDLAWLLSSIVWATVCGTWCRLVVANPCRTVYLTALAGKVEGTGSGEECGWHIKPGIGLSSIDFWPRVARFLESDQLSLHSARSGNFEHLATFSSVVPMPVGFTLTGSSEVLLSLQAKSNQTHIELDYHCEARDTVASQYLPASFVVLATVSALAILCCLMLVYLLCFCRARWRLEHTLQASQVVFRLELPQHLHEAEERVSWALEVLPTQRWQGSRVEEPEECCLCLEIFSENDLLRLLPCRHAFHKDCVDRWFASRRYMPRSCPLCKRNPIAASTAWFGDSIGAVSTGAWVSASPEERHPALFGRGLGSHQIVQGQHRMAMERSCVHQVFRTTIGTWKMPRDSPSKSDVQHRWCSSTEVAKNCHAM